jgi:hypothetical protein
MEPAATMKAAASVETPEAATATKCDGALRPDREARGDRCPCHQRSGQLFSTHESFDHQFPPGATWRL